MKNDSKPEEVAASREDFLRFTKAHAEFFEAFSHLHSEMEAYLGGWEGIDERVAACLMRNSVEELEGLAETLREVTRGLRDINDCREERKGPMN